MPDYMDQYRGALARAESLKEALNHAQGLTVDGDRNPQNDKHRFLFTFTGIQDSQWASIMISLELSYGYYGSSSGYSASSDTAGKYITEALNRMVPSIAKLALEIAEQDAEKIKTDAINEAKELLREAGE